jgi:hypothetical protein
MLVSGALTERARLEAGAIRSLISDAKFNCNQTTYKEVAERPDNEVI